jgi:hypothetical protein
MVADREVDDGGAERGDVADCFMTTDESRGGFLVTTEVVLCGSQKEKMQGRRNVELASEA